MPPAAARLSLVIPALNEERSLPLVLGALTNIRPRLAAASPSIVLQEIVVVDNGSTDATARVAAAGGATVLREPRRGYGQACLTGLSHLESHPCDVVAFLDADFADDPAQLRELVLPIARGDADMVLGSRLLGAAEPGALLPQARYGNAVSVALIRLLYGHRYTDLGPFRAIGHADLRRLDMRDRNFGWTAEMQVKALQAGLRVREIPVPYRRRVGQSKITGTLSGTIKAGTKILWTIARLRVAGGAALTPARGPSSDR